MCAYRHPNSVKGQGDELVTPLIDDQDMPAIGEDREVGQQFADGQLIVDKAQGHIHERQRAGPAVGHAECLPVVEEHRSHRMAETSRLHQRRMGVVFGSFRRGSRHGGAEDGPPELRRSFPSHG